MGRSTKTCLQSCLYLLGQRHLWRAIQAKQGMHATSSYSCVQELNTSRTCAVSRLRMGLAFAIAAFGSLIGTPIDGALLGDSFTWSKPVIFSGVSLEQVSAHNH